jgi:hypothetical protein
MKAHCEGYELPPAPVTGVPGDFLPGTKNSSMISMVMPVVTNVTGIFKTPYEKQAKFRKIKLKRIYSAWGR